MKHKLIASAKLIPADKTLLSQLSQLAVVVDPQNFSFSHDTIPNFAYQPNFIATNTGLWSDGNTWSGGVAPTADSKVNIPNSVTVTYDLTSGADTQIKAITNFGALRFKQDANTRLRVATLISTSGGYLHVEPNSGKTAEIVIRNVSLAVSGDAILDPTQFGTALISLGRTRIVGREITPWMRLDSEPTSGATSVTLAQLPVGWISGQQVTIPPTYSGTSYNNTGADDVALIQGLTDTTLILSSSCLTYHTAAYDSDGTKRFKPVIFNNDRDVVIRSEQISGTRGHTFFGYGTIADLHYVKFYGLGRTTFDTVASGVNQIGRYALHMHHVDWKSEVASGWCARIIGCHIEDAMKWGYTIHDSHFILLSGNVATNVEQWPFTTEEASESHCLFDSNLAGRTRRFGAPDDGVGFWMESARCTMRNNVACAVRTGYWFNGLTHGAGQTFTVPRFPGDTVGETFSYIENGVGSSGFPFENNETFTGGVGVWLDHRRGVNRLQSVKAWSLWESITFGWAVGVYDNGSFPNYTLVEGVIGRGAVPDVNGVSRCVIISGDIQLPAGDTTAMGLRLNNMQNGFCEILHSRVEAPIGALMAMSPSAGAQSSGFPLQNPLRRTNFDNTLFVAPSGVATLRAFHMEYDVLGTSPPGGRTPAAGNYAYVKDHQRVSGADLQLYWYEQRSGYLTLSESQIPNDPIFVEYGAYVSGQTNWTNWFTGSGRATCGLPEPDWTTTRSDLTSGRASVLTQRRDSFTRADSTSALGAPSDGGVGYSVVSGTIGIYTNRAGLTSGYTGRSLALLDASGMVNADVRVRLASAPASGANVAVVARYAGASYFEWRYSDDGTDKKMSLYAFSGGNLANLATSGESADYSYTAASGDVLQLRVEGNAIIGIVNNTAVKSGMSQMNVHATQHGFAFMNNDTTSRVDDLRVLIPIFSG